MYVEGTKFELDPVGSGKGLVAVLCGQGRAFLGLQVSYIPVNLLAIQMTFFKKDSARTVPSVTNVCPFI
jgi:hypothetical protein